MKRTLFAAVAVLGALVLASPAWASGPPYTVSVGGSSAAGSHPYTAATPSGSTFQFRSSPTLGFTCSGLSLSGGVQSGTAVNPIATVTANAYTGCFFGSVPLALTMTAGPIVGTGTNATTGLETVDGTLTNVTITGRTTPASVCSFRLTGQMRGQLDETSQRLTINEAGFTGNLVASAVIGCLGVLTNGQSIDALGPLNVVSPDGAINLS